LTKPNATGNSISEHSADDVQEALLDANAIRRRLGAHLGRFPSEMDNSLSCRAHRAGLIGAATAVGLFASYGWLGQAKSFGPLVTNYARVLPLHSEHQKVARDFFDVIAILVFTYLVMACVEGFRSRACRWAAIACAGATFAASWAVALAVPPWDNSHPMHVGAETVTLYELVLMGGSAILFAVSLAYLIKERRAQFSAATFAAGIWRGFNLWLVGYLTLWGLALVFLTHPYFKGEFYANARLAFNWLLLVHLVVGLPYALFTNWLRLSVLEERKDPCFGLLVLYRRVYLAIQRRELGRLAWILRKPWVRTNFLDLFCVKFFFLPIMLCFVFGEGGAFFNAVGQVRTALIVGEDHNWSVLSYEMCLRVVLLADVVIATIGYAGTARWLGNKSRSVDPTMAGWVWALLCYPPFNHAPSVLLPFHEALGAPILSAPWLGSLCRSVMLVSFAIYAWATIAFGVRFSNMTNRGILCHGPYAYIRHPAYIAKSVAWLAELLPKLANPWQIVGVVLFSGMYVMRALTEERHLMSDPDYRDYCDRVPYRFIPGVI
jgi:protein-S-isoprenylcysteine O-methyltransferase Ste14